MTALAINPGPAAVTFWVPGIPKPGGSKRGFLNPKTKRVIITEDCKASKDWRTSVAFVADGAIPLWLPGPLRVTFSFYFLRPASHYGTGKNAGRLKPSAPAYPAVRPDVTKLVRSTEDALKAIAWRDDSQIVYQVATKRYADEGKAAGAQITISPAQESPALALTYTDQLAEEALQR